jgi:putative ABC transport system ATP-binding protein
VINSKNGQEAVISIRDMTKVYLMGEHEVRALNGVSLDIHKGEFVAIMGPSGSGKSTMMNMLGALDTPTDGRYFLAGTDVSKLNDDQLADIRNQEIGFVFQNFNLLSRTTAIQQVELPLIYAGKNQRRQRAREALELVGLGDRLDHKPSELSGGQQQRVAIARALVNEPAIILADEPTGNLDSKSGTEIMQIFQKLNRDKGITIIFVTHDPWIARHTRRVIRLADGLIVGDDLITEPLVAGEAVRPSDQLVK